MQATLERAIAQVTQETVRVVASGRTDAGAHALGQVVAFSTESRITAERLRAAINAHLPRDVAVTEVSDAAPDFHPRFAASRRVYRYLIWNRQIRSPFWEGRAAHVARPLAVARMNRAAQELVGARDFRAFVPTAFDGDRHRLMFSATCRREADLIMVDLVATGFMRQMVRSIVGTLIEVGAGKIGEAEFREIVRSGGRADAGTTAPAHGLYLVQVQFEEATAMRDRAAEPGYPRAPAAYSPLNIKEKE